VWRKENEIFGLGNSMMIAVNIRIFYPARPERQLGIDFMKKNGYKSIRSFQEE